MHVVLIGTYPPTRCGIATFTADVEQSLRSPDVEVTIIPVDPDEDTGLDITDRPVITSTDPGSYSAAAAWVNEHDVDVVLVQHEFGIFGGQAGSMVLGFVSWLKVPFVVTLHTVKNPFEREQAAAIKAICGLAEVVTVFTTTAQRLLLKQGLVDPDKVLIVPHGAPIELYQAVDTVRARKRLGLPSAGPVLSTFGLLSEGKGIELVLKALPACVLEFPDLRYVIAGRTHPGVLRRDGERYRDGLKRLIAELDLEANVVFHDRFMDIDEIADLLGVTSVFCTPYRGEEQVVSGALSFALAAGCPVVSTPYRYAADMLFDGAGLIIPFDDVESCAVAINTLLADGEPRRRAREAAVAAGRALSWPAVGQQTREVLSGVVAAGHRGTGPQLTIGSVASPPTRRQVAFPDQLGRQHLRVLCDDTAMLQHAHFRTPLAEHGYCVDDAARCLPIAARFASEAPAGESEHWAVTTTRLLAFIRGAAHEGGGAMRNFMSWDRRWLDQPHAGDHVGRAVWGLGDLVECNSDYLPDAIDIVSRVAPDLAQTPFSRNLAYTALGLTALRRARPDRELERALDQIHESMTGWQPIDAMWCWPEPRLTYDNARIPEALMAVGSACDDATMVETGAELFGFLVGLCTRDNFLRCPGHLGLGRDDSIGRSGDEQPLEAAALADAALLHFSLTGDEASLNVVELAWEWYVGRNRLGVSVGDIASGACCDGVGPESLNRNAGAESTLAFHRCWATRRRAANPGGRTGGGASSSHGLTLFGGAEQAP